MYSPNRLIDEIALKQVIFCAWLDLPAIGQGAVRSRPRAIV